MILHSIKCSLTELIVTGFSFGMAPSSSLNKPGRPEDLHVVRKFVQEDFVIKKSIQPLGKLLLVLREVLEVFVSLWMKPR